MDQTTLNYLTKVLGLREVLVSEGLVIDPVRGEEPRRARIACVFSQVLNSAEEELFQKMMAAIHLGSSEIDCFEGEISLEILADSAAPLVLSMTIEESDLGRWSVFGDKDVLRTFHPRLLIERPGLKREAWEHLKTLKSKLD